VNTPESQNPLSDWEQRIAAVERPELYFRLPGRYRHWEIGDIIDRHTDFRAMEDGMTSAGTRLYAVFRHDPELHHDIRTAQSHVGAASAPEAESTSAASATQTAGSREGLEVRARIFAAEPVDGAQQALMLGEPFADRQLVRMPGLFLRWELAPLFEPGADYHIEPAGALVDGSELFAVFQTKRAARPNHG
jgi:hypothetical protein